MVLLVTKDMTIKQVIAKFRKNAGISWGISWDEDAIDLVVSAARVDGGNIYAFVMCIYSSYIDDPSNILVKTASSLLIGCKDCPGCVTVYEQYLDVARMYRAAGYRLRADDLQMTYKHVDYDAQKIIPTFVHRQVRLRDMKCEVAEFYFDWVNEQEKGGIDDKEESMRIRDAFATIIFMTSGTDVLDWLMKRYDMSRIFKSCLQQWMMKSNLYSTTIKRHMTNAIEFGMNHLVFELVRCGGWFVTGYGVRADEMNMKKYGQYISWAHTCIGGQYPEYVLTISRKKRVININRAAFTDIVFA